MLHIDLRTSIIDCLNCTGQRALWEREGRNPRPLLRVKPIIRLGDGSHVTPYSDRNVPNAYPPSTEDTEFPTVRHILVADDKARQFLDALGLRPPALVDDLRVHVLPKYRHERGEGIDGDEPARLLRSIFGEDSPERASEVGAAEHARDMQKLARAVIPIPPDLVALTSMRGHGPRPLAGEGCRRQGEGPRRQNTTASARDGITTSPADKLAGLRTMVGNTALLRARNAATGDWSYVIPSSAYVRSDALALYFEDNPNAWFGDEDTTIIDASILDWLHVARTMRVEARQAYGQDHVTIGSERGQHSRGLEGFDPSCTVDGLDIALATPTVAKSAYIWNEILLPNAQYIRGIVEKATTRNYENSSKEERVSPMGALVRSRAWLPDAAGDLHPPQELALSDLPQEFHESELLADKLGMKQPELRELARAVGIDPDTLMMLRDHPKDVQRLVIQLRSRSGSDVSAVVPSSAVQPREEVASVLIDYTSEFRRAFQRPAAESSQLEPPELGVAPNPERRLDREIATIRARQEAEPVREARTSERRALVWEAKNEEVRVFLQQQYAGHCQICRQTFAKTDGQMYFEGLYLVPHTKGGWFDRNGNVLCLCPTCCAKMLYGPLEADTDIVDQVLASPMTASESSVAPTLRVRLCHEDVGIRFSQRHFLDLQALLTAAQQR